MIQNRNKMDDHADVLVWVGSDLGNFSAEEKKLKTKATLVPYLTIGVGLGRS